ATCVPLTHIFCFVKIPPPSLTYSLSLHDALPIYITAFLAIAMCQNDCFMRFCIIWKEFRFQFKIIIRCLFKGFKLLMIKPALCLCQYFLIFFTRNHLFLDFRVFLSTV